MSAGLRETAPLHRSAHRRSHPHRVPGAPAFAPVAGIAPGLRTVTYAICGALWLSGCAWLVLHYLLPHQSDFGPAPNPAEPSVLKLHGWLAVGEVFLLGWLGASHMSPRWSQWRQRTSGLVLAVLAGVLVLTGYGLYYTSDPVHGVVSLSHPALGAAAVAVALTHWRRPLRLMGGRRAGDPPI